MKRIHKILVGTAGVLSLAVMTAVVAAPDGSAGPFYGMGPGMGMGMGGMGMMHGGGPGAMSAQYLAQLKTQLAITPQQERVWEVFAAKASEQAALMQGTHALHHQGGDTNSAAPDVMSQHIGLMTQHLAGMQALNAALADLYAVLTPEQRSIADQQFGHMGPRGYGRGMRG